MVSARVARWATSDRCVRRLQAAARLSMTLTNTEGRTSRWCPTTRPGNRRTDLKFRFHMKQTTDTAVTNQTDGDALFWECTGGPGEVLHW